MSTGHVNPSPTGQPGPGMPGGQKFNRLWIGGLPRNVAIDDVRTEVNRVFSSYGPVADVCVITTARDVMCFVQYDDEQVAFNAREDLNGKMILGSVIKVNYAVIRGPDAPKPASRMPVQASDSPSRAKAKDPNRKMIFISNLPSDVTAEELAYFGNSVSYDVSFANVWKEGNHTYGLLTFDSTRDALKAKRRLNGATLGGPSGAGSKSKPSAALSTYSLDEFNDMLSSSSKRRK